MESPIVNFRILSRLALASLLAATLTSAVACRNRCTTCRPARSCAPQPMPAAPITPADAVRMQVERGGVVYAQQCARCHGAGGGGGPEAPALVGATALPLDPPAGRRFRTGPFRTAGDVAQFVVTTMPPGGPKLVEADAWAVLGFALKANGVTLAEPVGPATAAAIVLHP